MPNTTPRNAQEALGQANRYERAKQLLTDGYTFTFDAELNAVYVCKPGRLYAEYTIGEQLSGRDGCSCPDFQKTGKDCKHMLAWEAIKAEQADEAEMWESICARYDEEEGWADGSTKLPRLRALLLTELKDAEHRAMTLNSEPFAVKSAVRSWADKAHRCKLALRQFDETLTKVQTGLLTL